jgi:enoyl-CoA hydratase/carnithine racemase
VLSGRRLAATEARDWGLVAEVDPDCGARAAALAASWAAAPGAGLLRRALAAAERLDPAEAVEFDQELRALLPDR